MGKPTRDPARLAKQAKQAADTEKVLKGLAANAEKSAKDSSGFITNFVDEKMAEATAHGDKDRQRIADEGEASRRKNHVESTDNQRAIMAQQRADSAKLEAMRLKEEERLATEKKRLALEEERLETEKERLETQQATSQTIERLATKLDPIEGTSAGASVKTALFAGGNDPSVAAPGAPGNDPENLKLKARLAREEAKSARLRKEKQALEQRAREEEVGRKNAEEKFNAVSYEPNPKSNPTEIRPEPKKPTGRTAASREDWVKNKREHRRKQAQAENGQRLKM